MTKYRFNDEFIITGFELGFLHRLSKDYEIAKELVENVLKRPYTEGKDSTKSKDEKVEDSSYGIVENSGGYIGGTLIDHQ